MDWLIHFKGLVNTKPSEWVSNSAYSQTASKCSVKWMTYVSVIVKVHYVVHKNIIMFHVEKLKYI
jgi:hypothetical protein